MRIRESGKYHEHLKTIRAWIKKKRGMYTITDLLIMGALLYIKTEDEG